MESCWAPLASGRPSFQRLKLVLQDAFALAFAEGAVEQEGGGMCVVCLERVASMALVPCGHRCVCEECAPFLPGIGCPICRAPVEKSVRVFDS